MNRESERKRLVEVISDTKDICPAKVAMNQGRRITCDGCKYEYSFNCRVEMTADKILADGWMRPPFEIGTDVYVVIDNMMPLVPKDVYRCKVRWYAIGIDGVIITIEVISDNIINGANLGVSPEDLFLTREEALKALEGKEDEGK
jgi:hypothetical protein